jgi:hypothetical protein
VAYIDLQTATIANGTALSPECMLGQKSLVGIIVPTSWTSASLTFQVTVDDVNFFEMVDETGAAIKYNVAAGQYIAIDPARWLGVTGIKLRSGTLAAPVNQTAAAALTIVTRTVY